MSNVRLIPPRTKEATRFIGKLTFKDLCVTLIFWLLMFFVIASTLPFVWKAIVFSFILVVWIVSIQTINFRKGYQFVSGWFVYFLKVKKIEKTPLVDLTNIKFDDYVRVGSRLSAIIEINGIDFEILSQRKQTDKVRRLSQVIRGIKNGSIVKLETPIDFSAYIAQSKKKQERLAAEMMNDTEDNTDMYTQRIDILSNSIDYLDYRQNMDKVMAEAFYLIIHDYTETNLATVVQNCMTTLQDMGLMPKKLSGDELLLFYKRYFDCADQEELCIPKIKEKWNKITLNGEDKKILAVGEYPFFVSDGWGWEIFSIPGTKVVYNFSNSPKKNIYKNIDRTVAELESQYADRKAGVSDRTDVENKIRALNHLVDQLKLDKEQLHQVGLYIICDSDKQKEVEEVFKESVGIINDDLYFRQLDAYISMLPYLPMPEKTPFEVKEMQTSTFAACFPFVSKLFLDVEGSYLGAGRYPIFFDLFVSWKQLDRKRTNSNMSVLGKSGNGKTYFVKKLLMQQACEGTKIFILDPENEYDWLCKQLHGNWIDVGGVSHGIINPMQVFPSLKPDEDEDNQDAAWGQVSIHRQFLEEFFHTVLPDMDKDCKPFLNKIIAQAYSRKKIYDTTNLENLKTTDFPILQDLYDIAQDLLKDKSKMDEWERLCYYKLLNYLADFAEGGLHSKLWNGHTTLALSNNFSVLNFQSLMANHNYTVANGQMLLIMRYLNQEVIRNKEYNDKHTTPRNILIAVDEAHAFINKEFPVALRFMAQMSKRIRKYGGSLIVPTQNIDDFIGTSEQTRALASAVINNCQYSVVFGLNPDDINKVIDLYKDFNGGLTQTEVDFLTEADQGMALFIIDSNTRFKAHVHLYHGEEKFIIKPKIE